VEEHADTHTCDRLIREDAAAAAATHDGDDADLLLPPRQRRQRVRNKRGQLQRRDDAHDKINPTGTIIV
jgi:hypothetical protein